MLVIFKENVILILSFWLDYDNLVNCFAVNKNQREMSVVVNSRACKERQALLICFVTQIQVFSFLSS